MGIAPISIITATTNQVIGLNFSHLTFFLQQKIDIKKKNLNLFFLSIITIYFLNLLAIAILVITFHVLLKIQNNTKSLIHFKMAINNRLYVIKPAPIKWS